MSSIYIAYYILLTALVVIGFGDLKLWQRVVSLAAFVSVVAVMMLVNP